MAKVILVVDDEPSMIKVAQAILGDKGYKIVGATSGRECLEKLKKSKPKLILLDLRMPEMDGWDVLKEIRQNRRTKSIPVMMYTRMEKSPDEETLRERGVDDYIVKPFAPDELVRKVEKLTKKK